MLPALATIIAVYAVARLIQVPLELDQEDETRWPRMIIACVSAVAIVAIVVQWQAIQHLAEQGGGVKLGDFAPPAK